ncbi:Uncharacterized membrane protein YfcA [Pustulibacterium marinum]|uniref:Uncharacterized membrane protein YfcA n=1 Tax=Pustulibacterium marinum TaxID=1224947 RepID=A0A1I7HBC1_9FLAO|nr:DUF2723 domain-containing protein [Pustulibacterium marinum]SFU57786.1 Uncharacterized membrane protein YfcA [Pustulibacterium marinum]
MFSRDFNKWNTITGWLVFFAALLTYGLTVEPTASFWDCGEYISTSAKLQVGHPPGAPFFQMMGAFFAMFAANPEKVALMVNFMSVFSSAFAVLFMFWSVTNLTKKMVLSDNTEFTNAKAIAILGSGIVGGLALTFSDSFWFNAVEAEVYAMAIFMMSLMFWLGLKWTDNLNDPRGSRWLILIALVIGLSFGVHFMALLTIPAIGMMYFFRSHYEKNLKNFIIANVVSVAILLFIFKLLLPYTLALFGYLEVFFVNSVGLPFNSGTIIATLLIIGAFYYGLSYSKKKEYINLNTGILCTVFVLIGFSTWLMIPIRANANTVINENDPSDARTLLAYYNLEQYPETHLLYGPMYSQKYVRLDPNNPYVDGKPKYEKNDKTGKYEIVNYWKGEMPNLDDSQKGLLPRMWSEDHAANYMKRTDILDFNIKADYVDSEELRTAVSNFRSQVASGSISVDEYENFLNDFQDYLDIERPTLGQNLSYFGNFQIWYMYFRYFGWNFIGRSDDIQGKQDGHGRVLSGVKIIDDIFKSQDNLPSDDLNNAARNTYFFLPLILGIVGILFQASKSERQFWILLVLFLFTGIALKLYLNERPFEPRERDYALVGSFYVFCMWIGIGVYGIFDAFRKVLTPKILAPVVVLVSLLAVPTVMAYENWDDHDRSNRYTAQSMAKSYLDSVQEDSDPILFTIGDNDTFALWYAQEIEGYRTDIRTINTQLFATAWYIDQMKRQTYESSPIPSQLSHDQYKYGTRDQIVYIPLTEERWDIKRFMDFISSDNPKYKVGFVREQQGYDMSQQPESYRQMNFYPTNKIRVPVNKQNVLESGLVKPEDADLIVDYIDIDLPKSQLIKNRMMMLDILANNDWKRPIYFTGGSYDASEYMWMKDYLQLDGMVYKLVPIKTEIDKNNPYEMGRIDSDLMFNIVKQWHWGNSGDPDVYLDPETRRNSINYRGNIARLVEQLIKEGKNDQAEEAIAIVMDNMPVDRFGYYFLIDPYIDAYYKLGEQEKARALFKQVAKHYQESLKYYSTLSQDDKKNNSYNIERTAYQYTNLLDIVRNNTDMQFLREQGDVFNSYIELFGGIEDDALEELPETSTELDSSMPKDTIKNMNIPEAEVINED